MDGGPAQTDTALARYDAMVTAIAECERVDEVKDIRDKAVALEAYYRQARNLEAERQAANVRLRAERRSGELLKELARAETASGGDTGANQYGRRVAASDGATPPSEYTATLDSMGMSRQQAHRFQSLANVDEREFEAALADPGKPSANGIIARTKLKSNPPQAKVADEALWLWGRLRDFERMGFLENDPEWALESMTDAMRADVLRLAPHVADFLTNLGDEQ